MSQSAAPKRRVVASGTWYYDKSVPRRIEIYAKEARFHSSRFDEYDDQLIESKPIPSTLDGFFYVSSLGWSGEHLTIEEVKAWADAQPWGPVKWD